MLKSVHKVLHYMDPSVEVHHMLFSQFIKQIQGRARELSKRQYSAQQDLGDIPSLSDDIVEPEMCRNTGYRKVYKTNIWFGWVRWIRQPLSLRSVRQHSRSSRWLQGGRSLSPLSIRLSVSVPWINTKEYIKCGYIQSRLFALSSR